MTVSNVMLFRSTIHHEPEKRDISAYFDRIKGNDSLLKSFLSSFCYADLHCHVQGMIRPIFWAKLAEKYGIESDLKAFKYKEFERTVSVIGHPVEEHDALFNAWRDNVGKVMKVCNYMDLIPGLVDAIVGGNILYCEPILEIYEFNFDTEKVKDFIEAFKKALPPSYHVKFKCGLMRSVPAEEFRVQLNFASILNKTYPDWFAGIEVMGPEDWPDVEENLPEQLRMINDTGLTVSMHVGELQEGVSGVPAKTLRNRVSTVVKGLKDVKKLTLGHLNSLSTDRHWPELVKEFKNRKISLVTLPVSNRLILNSTPRNHIIHFFYEHGLMPYLSVGTDDPGIACMGIEEQYMFILKALPKLTYRELRNLMINAFEHSHLNGEGIYDFSDLSHPKLKPMFHNPDTAEAREFCAKNEKAKIQLHHLLHTLKVESLFDSSSVK